MSRRTDIDFEHSRAILVGTSTYEAGFADRGPMPAAMHSLDAMRQVLAGPCEWPATRITEFRDERDSGSLLRTISRQLSDVTDVIVCYFVGHGQPIFGNGRYDLGLALTDTSEEITQRSLTSLRFRDLREQMDQSRARIKIFILDCCCSGIATEYAESATNATVDGESGTPLRGAGTYIWTACRHAEETFFEEHAGGLTYFTKLLAEAVRDAPPSGATVAELHDEVKRRLSGTRIPHAERTPTPDLRFSGQPDQFRFVHGNTAGRRSGEFRFGPLMADDPTTGGPYRLVARLGAGSTARMYLAFNPAGQPIAVTLMKPYSGFARDVEIAWPIRGSHVAGLLDAQPQAVQPWLASEYVCGPTLRELVAETGPLPTRDILLIVDGVARALVTIHESGAVHGHLDPASIRVDDAGPKVIDMVTAAVLASDQVNSRPVTPASDVFALGAVGCFLATGEHPFESEDQAATREPPDLSVLDEPIRSLVRACVASDPAARPTAAQLVQAWSAGAGAGSRISSATSAIRARADALRAITPEPPRQPDPPHPEPPPFPPPWFQPPQPPVRPDDAVRNKRKARGLVVLAIVGVIIALASTVPGQPPGNDNAGSSGPLVVTTDPDTFSEPPAPLYVPPPVPTYSPIPTSSSPTQSAAQAAQIGDCFANDGSFEQPDLLPTTCQVHVFKVIQVVQGTTDTSECPVVANNDYDVPFPTDDLVLCLAYQPSNTGYHALAKDCVFIPDQSFTSVTEQSCQTGNFTVLARLNGTTDPSGCQSYPKTDETPRFTTPWPQLDAVLCLAINYPNAAGIAQVGRCLYMTGSGSLANFVDATCNKANVVVNGRIGVYDDVAYCAGYGWTTWGSTDFPQFDYTVCFRSNN